MLTVHHIHYDVPKCINYRKAIVTITSREHIVFLITYMAIPYCFCEI